MFDPTKATYLYPPENQQNFKKSTENGYGGRLSNVENFTSLMCHGILNVSQVLNTSDHEKFSIPINPEFVTEKLSYQEILSDIVLYQLITAEEDRHLLPTSCRRDGESIMPHNCMIFTSGNYSIFDIYDFGPKISKDKVFEEIFYFIRELYGNDYLDDLSFFNVLFITPEEDDYNHIGKQGFFQRMLTKIDEFLERYDGEEGKKFFLRQKAKSEDYKTMPEEYCDKPDFWYDEDMERYKNLIFTLKNIKEVIDHENIKDIALEYLCLDYNFTKKDLKSHIEKSFELLMQLIYIKIKKGVNKILGKK